MIYVVDLKHNLLNISQLCDKGLKFNFNKDSCIIEDEMTHETELVGKRISNILKIFLDDLSLKLKCIVLIITKLGYDIEGFLIHIWTI